MAETITVGIADAKLASDGDILVTYALGSCVGVCLYETTRHIAGMVHILLPSRDDSLNNWNDYKFADTGIQKLVKAMIQHGANQKCLTAKIAGGAEMFKTQLPNEAIGRRNVYAVKETLRALKIPLVSERTGDTYGRTIWFYSSDGSLKIRSIKHAIEII